MALSISKTSQIYRFIPIVCLIAFFPVLQADFMYYDDPEYVINNPYIKNISFNNIAEIFKGKATILYVPLTIISYQIEYCFYKLNPIGFHVVNLILHIFNCILLLKLLQKLKMENFRLICIILIFFAIHPLITESVCWITERKDVLYCLFYFLTANAFLDYYHSKKIKSYLSMFLFFVLACFSKPMAINLSALVVIFIFYKENKSGFKKMLAFIPFFIVSAIFAYVSIVSIKNGATGRINISGYSVGQKIFLFISELGYYFVKPFLPFTNSLFHLFPAKEELFLNRSIIVYFIIFCIVSTCLLIYIYKTKDRKILFLFLAWLVVLLPILQIYPNTHSYVSERYFYVSIIFPSSIIALIFLKNESKQQQGMFLVYSCLILFIFLTFKRSLDWKNTEKLMLSELKENPENARALNNLGYYYNQKGQFELAASKLRIAVRSDSTNSYYLNNYGWALGGKGLSDSAIYYFGKANFYKKNYFEAINNLAISYCMRDKFTEAKPYFDKAESLNPNHPDLLYNFGAYYLKKGDRASAKVYFKKAVERGNRQALRYLNI